MGNGGLDKTTASRYHIFARLAEATWPHLEIRGLETTPDIPFELSLFVRDGPFVAEAGWVGHGLQAWLQTCWFLARCNKQSTIVLDEPDVFLHADLQRKLVRLVKGHFKQVLIATHSTEFLAEVNADSVLIVDKESNESKFAETLPAVQTVINNIGSANNLQLTRLWSAKRCLFVEGNDFEILNALHQIIYPDSLVAFNSLPCISIDGFANWKMAVGAAMGLKNAGDESIKPYCVLDADYRDDEEDERIYKQAKKHGLYLHIWKWKEIENYLLRPSTISRLIEIRSTNKSPKIETVEAKIGSICDSMKDDVIDKISDQISLSHRKKNPSTTNKEARVIVEGYWSTYKEKISLCSGKQIISALSGWSQEKYGVSFSPLAIARNMELSEIDPEVISVVTAIERSEPFKI